MAPQVHPWEEFPFLERYYGGIRSIVQKQENVPEYPNEKAELEEIANLTSIGREESEPEEASQLERRTAGNGKQTVSYNPYHKDAGITECFLDEHDKIRVPDLSIHNGVIKGMPDPLIGSSDVLGMRSDICFDRFGRLAPYGLGYTEKKGGSGAGLEGDRAGIEEVWQGTPQVDWRDVKWNQAQKRCIEKNSHRFKTSDNSSSAKSGTLSRTAVLIRTWHDYEYDAEDLFYLRALAAELSINSGGEYEIHFLVHVKDDNLQIWADDATYNHVLNASLPAEFAGMGTLWSERQMGLIYGGLADTMYRELPVHGVYRSAFMPVQYFAHTHPEFDHFWHWEMDVRYIGHYYELVDRVSKWAKEQPRKGLWERGGRFYLPSEHGSWEDFKHMVRVQTEHGTSSSWKNSASNSWTKLASSSKDLPENMRPKEQHKAETPVWGPVDSIDTSDRFEPSNDPKPEGTLKEDKDTWGVDEEADMIVFNPLFDPEATEWLLADDYTGYNLTSSNPPPRRASIGTTGRYSRRLLEIMHRETALGRHTMFSEMWPATTCLHHGLKAVYAPHPVYVDRRWPTSYAAAIFNNGRNGASGGARRSVFSEDQQHNFLGSTWYYNAGFAPNLWSRWLGYKVNNDGGEEFEISGEGRMCLPSMLLHPVKHVELVREHGEWDEIAEDDEIAREGDTRSQRVQDDN